MRSSRLNHGKQRINGQITADEYYQITGEYPYGYTPPGTAVSSGGDSGSGGGGGWDPGNHAYVNRENYYRVTGKDPWGIFEKK